MVEIGRPTARRAAGFAALAALVVSAAASAPAVGAGARVAGNEPETAASQLVSVVQASYGRSRAVETQCSGRAGRLPYSCNYWIIKRPNERRRDSSASAVLVGAASFDPLVPIVMRAGEGNQHSNRARVWRPGTASAVAYSRGTFTFRVR